MRAITAVGVHYYLPARKSRVAHRSAYDKLSRGVDVVLCITVQQPGRDNRLDYLFYHVAA